MELIERQIINTGEQKSIIEKNIPYMIFVLPFPLMIDEAIVLRITEKREKEVKIAIIIKQVYKHLISIILNL